MPSRGGFKNGQPAPLSRLVQLDERGKKRLGLEIATIVRERAFPSKGAGRDEDDRPYEPYSTKRLYVSKKSPPRPADMPAPKGGRKPPRIKRAADAKTVRYDDGYSEYRAGIGRSSGANVNLVLTGQTARALSFIRSTARSIVVGFRTRRERARALDARYRFMGLTPAETRRVLEIWRRLVADQIRNGTKGLR